MSISSIKRRPIGFLGTVAPLCISVSLVAWLSGCQVIDRPTNPNGDGTSSVANVTLGKSWEPAANSIKLADEPISDVIEIVGVDEAARQRFARRAQDDQGWRSRNGARFGALYVAPSGKAYGRPGDAVEWPAPDAKAGRGSAGFTADASTSQADVEAVALPVELTEPKPEAGPARARIGTDWTIDRRSRQSSINALTSVPLRMVGAMSNSDPQRSGCTGTKIGPRAVLTAAHCVMDEDGNISRSGWFHPGKTNAQTPNGSMRWQGVFLRDWRIHPRHDYAVVFLDDSAAAVGLGWLGVHYWNDSAGYAGRGASLHGYPCGPDNAKCGPVTAQRCKASPRADKRCDGWMYSHSRNLTASSFRDDELLQYDHDMSSGQSGAAVYVQLSPGDRRVVAVNTHSWGGVSMGARFRASMWNDVCSWIAAVPSAFGSHNTCN